MVCGNTNHFLFYTSFHILIVHRSFHESWKQSIEFTYTINSKMNNAMKKYKRKFLTALLLLSLMGCGDSQQHSNKKNDTDTISNQTLAKKTDMKTQKITPCLWVDKDAKAVANYYLSIFKDSKLKEHRKYKNPPEAGGGERRRRTQAASRGCRRTRSTASCRSSASRHHPTGRG